MVSFNPLIELTCLALLKDKTQYITIGPHANDMFTTLQHPYTCDCSSSPSQKPVLDATQYQ